MKELSDAIDYSKPTEKNIWVDKKFHELLIEITGNPLLIQIYTMLSKMQANLMSRLMCYEDVVMDASISHHKILEAIMAKNEEGCVNAMEEHLDNVAKYYQKYYIK